MAYVYGPWSSGRRGLNPSHQNGAGAWVSRGVTRQNQCTHPAKSYPRCFFPGSLGSEAVWLQMMQKERLDGVGNDLRVMTIHGLSDGLLYGPLDGSQLPSRKLNGAWLSGMTDCSAGSTSDGISKSSSELTDGESSMTSATSSAIGSSCATAGCITSGLPLPFRTRPACFLASAKGL